MLQMTNSWRIGEESMNKRRSNSNRPKSYVQKVNSSTNELQWLDESDPLPAPAKLDKAETNQKVVMNDTPLQPKGTNKTASTETTKSIKQSQQFNVSATPAPPLLLLSERKTGKFVNPVVYTDDIVE
jgi:hypothetical protein